MSLNNCIDKPKKNMGWVHSIESFGAVDGPGIRYVVFLQGCPFRCLYCHNPDSWKMNTGIYVDSETVVNDIKRYNNFIKKGGVTISGGEPLVQADFVADIIRKCHEEGIHVAVDTSGGMPLTLSKEAVREADLILLDIKATTEEDLGKITGTSKNFAYDILDFREKIGKPVWIRYVLVPGLTMEQEMISRLGKSLENYSCIEKVELLPFHQMGVFKWEELGLDYALEDTLPPTQKEIEEVKKILSNYDIKVFQDK